MNELTRQLRRAQRAHTELSALKRTYWAEHANARGPEVMLEVADGLRAHMQAVRPDWPTEADRQADLEHHLRLRALFDRTAHVFTGR